jgi:hypothetical protein
VAATSTGLAKAQANDPFLNGRPLEAVGPPITIYEPTFSTFRAMNQGTKSVDISPTDYGFVEDFLVASAKIYTSEKERQIAITKPLEGLLGRVFIQSTLNDGTSNDGTIQATFGPFACLLLVREVKNEGGNGDPSAQAGYSYSRWWADPLVRIFGTAVSITLTLSRGLTFASGCAALASSSPSRVPGFACKEESSSANPGQCNH